MLAQVSQRILYAKNLPELFPLNQNLMNSSGIKERRNIIANVAHFITLQGRKVAKAKAKPQNLVESNNMQMSAVT